MSKNTMSNLNGALFSSGRDVNRFARRHLQPPDIHCSAALPYVLLNLATGLSIYFSLDLPLLCLFMGLFRDFYGGVLCVGLGASACACDLDYVRLFSFARVCDSKRMTMLTNFIFLTDSGKKQSDVFVEILYMYSIFVNQYDDIYYNIRCIHLTDVCTPAKGTD